MRTTATYRLVGPDGLTAAAVTQRLGLQPTKAFEVCTPVSSRSRSIRGTSGWLLQSSPQVESGVELETHLHRLLVLLEPLAQPLWDLVDAGYWANWFCFVASEATEHAVELDRRLLSRLLALPGDLWIDSCGDPDDE
nr:DUF4279 domain-containing protein [Pseudofrankia inefficax]